ncbi:MAG: hypothetical protein ACOCRO_09050 [Halanaerobiales bacterium]
MNKSLDIIGFGRIDQKIAEYFIPLTEANIYVYYPVISEKEKSKLQR